MQRRKAGSAIVVVVALTAVWFHAVVGGAPSIPFVDASKSTQWLKSRALDGFHAYIDPVKLARIKGLPEGQVVWRHAFKNAALPVLTFAALLFVNLLNGSIIVETVFSWPGVGLLVIEAVRYRDYPVVQTVVMFLSTMYICANLAVDVLYAYLNPRIRYGS